MTTIVSTATKKATELLENLPYSKVQLTKDELLLVMRNQPTDKVKVKDFFKRGVLHTELKVWFNKNGSKMKTPCFIKHSGVSKLPFTVWNEDEVKEHNEFLNNTTKPYSDQPYSDFCKDAILLFNNDQNLFEGDKDLLTVCLDVDSEDELYRLYDCGFPVFETPYTLSTTKRLPHFWFKTRPKYHQKLLGKNLPEPCDCDLLNDLSFERLSGKVFQADCYDDSVWNNHLCDKVFGEGNWENSGTHRDEYAERRENSQKRVSGGEAKTRTNHTTETTEVELGGVRLQRTHEVLPLFVLHDLVMALDVERMSAYNMWWALVQATTNMVDSANNPNDYLKLLNEFYKKSSRYDPSWDNENAKEVAKALNNPRTKDYGVNFLFAQLMRDNRQLWVKLAFSKNRKLDPMLFKKLYLKEAREVMNEHVSFVMGEQPHYVEYKAVQKKFVYYKEPELKQNYANLKWTARKQKLDKEGEPTGEYAEETCNKFVVKNWLEWEGKSQYEGLTFAPPPRFAHDDEYNLFTGFDCDLYQQYDDEINQLTKEELEDKLSFMLGHLRYLSGEDQTDEMFDYQLKYFAHLLKYPGVLPRVMLIWISVPGCGKNQFLNFHKHIVGDRYFHSTANKEEVVGNFNSSIRHKLLYNINEMRNAHEIMERLKELITEQSVSSTKKFQEAVLLNNFIRLIGTSNLKNPIPIEFKDRRLVVVRCNPVVVSDSYTEMGYFNTLQENITSLYIQKCWLRYCREFVVVDKDYNFEKNRVFTNEYKMLKTRNVPYQLRFMRYLYNVRMKNKSQGKPDDPFTQKKLYTEWLNFKMREGEKLDISKSNLMNELEMYKQYSTGTEYLEQHPDHFITLEGLEQGKKQKYYTFNWDRMYDFLHSECIDGMVSNYEFQDSSSDEDSDDE